jgi:hypothetical protein
VIDEDEDNTLIRMPSYREWLNTQNDAMDQRAEPPSARNRAWKIAGETPLKFFTAIAYRAAYGGTSDYLRRQNRKSVPVGTEEERLHLNPEQMELPQIQAFLIANYDRRLADVTSERRFVADWCDAHSGFTPSQVYAMAGVKMPAIPKRP